MYKEMNLKISFISIILCLFLIVKGVTSLYNNFYLELLPFEKYIDWLMYSCFIILVVFCFLYFKITGYLYVFFVFLLYNIFFQNETLIDINSYGVVFISFLMAKYYNLPINKIISLSVFVVALIFVMLQFFGFGFGIENSISIRGVNYIASVFFIGFIFSISKFNNKMDVVFGFVFFILLVYLKSRTYLFSAIIYILLLFYKDKRILMIVSVSLLVLAFGFVDIESIIYKWSDSQSNLTSGRIDGALTYILTIIERFPYSLLPFKIYTLFNDFTFEVFRDLSGYHVVHNYTIGVLYSGGVILGVIWLVFIFLLILFSIKQKYYDVSTRIIIMFFASQLEPILGVSTNLYSIVFYYLMINIMLKYMRTVG